MVNFVFIFFFYLILLLTRQILSLDCSIYQTNDDILNHLSRLYPIDPFDTFSNSKSWIKPVGIGHFSIRIVNASKIPSIIFCAKKILRFEIRSSSFEEPNEFGENLRRFASTLSRLIVIDTKIGDLNENFGEMINLRTLHLINVGLRFLPDSTKKLTLLTDIDLSRNDLIKLPVGWNSLKMLTSFVVSQNPRLTSLDELNGHPFLQQIRAQNCSIRNLPRNLSKVNDFYLSYNQIENLNGIETIGSKSSTAKNFYFDHNKIGRIPLSVVEVPNLSRLTFDSNLLLNIPKTLLEVKTLESISFNDNPIEQNELKQTIDKFKKKFSSRIF